MPWIELGAADGTKLGFTWRLSGVDKVGTLAEGYVIVALRDKGVFHVPRSLVDGTIDPPSRWGEHTGWICEEDFDFLIHAYSNGNGESCSGLDAARDKVGVGSWDYAGLTELTVHEIKQGLWQRLCAAGFAVATDRVKQIGTTRAPIYDLLVPPYVPPTGELRPVPVKATLDDLEAEGEPYFFVPRAVMTDKMWKQLRYHWLRRILLAVYCFNDLAVHGGVDPDVLRLEDEGIWLSDEFLAAAGNDDAAQVVRGLDFMAHHCGLANWIPVTLGQSTTRPGERRLVYEGDSQQRGVSVFRPTLQHKPAWERWRNQWSVDL